MTLLVEKPEGGNSYAQVEIGHPDEILPIVTSSGRSRDDPLAEGPLDETRNVNVRIECGPAQSVASRGNRRFRGWLFFGIRLVKPNPSYAGHSRARFTIKGWLALVLVLGALLAVPGGAFLILAVGGWFVTAAVVLAVLILLQLPLWWLVRLALRDAADEE